MTKRITALGVASGPGLIATIACVLLLPGVAVAWHDGGSPDRGVRPPAIGRPSAPPRTTGTPPRSPFVRYAPFIIQTPPPVVYVPSPPVVYVVPPADSSPEPDSNYDAPTPPVEPAREIVLPSGRWELHGDGVTWPHIWVWVATYQPPPPAPRVEPPPPPPPR
jgi:hypothetical protein